MCLSTDIPDARHVIPVCGDGVYCGELNLLMRVVDDEASRHFTYGFATRNHDYDISVHDVDRAIAWRVAATSAEADSVASMASAPTAESTPQRLAAICEQLKLLADYL